MATISLSKPFKWHLKGFPNLARISEPCHSTLAADYIQKQTSSQSPASNPQSEPQSSNPPSAAENVVNQITPQDWETGKRFYEDTKSRGISPDVVTYNTMINGYNRFKLIDEAEKLFTVIKGRNLAPTVTWYTTMLKGYVLVGRVDDALKIFEEMKYFGIKPNAFMYTTLLPRLCDADKVPEARVMLKEMVEKHVAHKIILSQSCQCNAGDLNANVYVLEAMVRLSIPTETGCYGILIENLRQVEVYDQAVNFLDKIMVAKVLEALLLRGHVKLAVGRIDLLMQSGCTSNFGSLLSIFCEKGKTIAALKILDFCLERDCDIDFAGYDKVLDALLAVGETLNAYSILCRIMEKGVTPDWSCCEDIIRSLNQEGNTKLAYVLSRKTKRDNTSGAEIGRFECCLILPAYDFSLVSCVSITGQWTKNCPVTFDSLSKVAFCGVLKNGVKSFQIGQI
ncbi:hypothetical protein FEM48_Zijuj11G0074100 [Ziziphus jujuba var. spinosa]|uniref:Pentatricopeptide repeat-containing protein n=1 Tax=Ziziphus jujuba var. spinosa TaxID=714518 RepID=A0A978UHL9_ZIZJJ|nr:hypothetical protein FEM48_Zijuj11G0074100 [Ziziphus jujuba var. spinosa]